MILGRWCPISVFNLLRRLFSFGNKKTDNHKGQQNIFGAEHGSKQQSNKEIGASWMPNHPEGKLYQKTQTQYFKEPRIVGCCQDAEFQEALCLR